MGIGKNTMAKKRGDFREEGRESERTKTKGKNVEMASKKERGREKEKGNTIEQEQGHGNSKLDPKVHILHWD